MSIHPNSLRVLIAAFTVVLTCSISGASEFSERLASWQGGSPPTSGSPAAPQPARPSPATHLPAQHADPIYYGGDEGPVYWGGSACGGCTYGCDSCCGPYHGCNTLVWARFEALLWWREGRDLPPLVTTDPAAEPSATAGILPDATILFGNGNEASDMSAGGRFDIGFWSDPRQCYGLGWRFFGLGNDGMGFHISSLDNPVLAIPVFDVGAGDDNAVLISYPGLRRGEINISGESELYGNDVYGRFLLCRDTINRWDFVTGWHFSRINDQLQLTARTEDLVVPQVDTFRDQFSTRSEFHGGILGMIWERQCGCWSTQVLTRMALGGMHERVVINGTRTIEQPGLPPVVVQGGIFTAASNIGTFERTEFTAVTELGVTCGYRIGNCTELTLGYTFLYWHDVQRVGDAIDTGVADPAGVRPQFDFDDRGFWVQGLNLGFTREF